MSDLFASRAATSTAGAASPRNKTSGNSRSSAMSKLIEEGRSLNTEISIERKRKPRSRMWDVIQGVGILACFVFIGIQMYMNFGGGAILSPTEIAAEERQRDQIQRCVMVFWEIAEVLKQGQTPNESLRCTEPGSPNIVARVDNDIIVRHPSPQLLGYSDIFVTKNNPVPVLVQ